MAKKVLVGILLLLVLVYVVLIMIDDEPAYPMPKYCVIECSNV